MSEGEFNLHEYYARREEEFRRSIYALEGRLLREVVLQIVEPQINVVFLRFDGAMFAVQGDLGSELLTVFAHEGEPPSDIGPAAWYERFDAAEIFHGRLVKQVRPIGAVWNGHGIEISFSGITDRTLIIQSIYAGDRPNDFFDCLRIGIATYDYRRTQKSDA